MGATRSVHNNFKNENDIKNYLGKNIQLTNTLNPKADRDRAEMEVRSTHIPFWSYPLHHCWNSFLAFRTYFSRLLSAVSTATLLISSHQLTNCPTRRPTNNKTRTRKGESTKLAAQLATRRDSELRKGNLVLLAAQLTL